MPILAIALAAATVECSQATAQGKAAAKKGPVDDSITARDSWQLGITYWESNKGEEAPVVILLHMQGGNRLVWKNGLGDVLQSDGYAVIAVDLRKHGDSKGRGGEVNKFDYANMATQDLEAVKKFIYAEHQKKKLNMRKTAIVAPGFSAPIAVYFTWLDWLKKPHDDNAVAAFKTPRGQDVQALVLLSPDDKLPGFATGQHLLGVANNPYTSFLTVYATGDPKDRSGRNAKNVHKKLTTTRNKDRIYSKALKVRLRGTQMLGRNLKVEELIRGFLKKHLMGLPNNDLYKWRNRQSRLQR